MKKLLSTLSLPIGIIILALLAVFPSQREWMVSAKNEKQTLRKKEEEELSAVDKEVRELDSLKRTRKSVLKSYVIQQLKDWNCMIQPREKKK